MSWSKAVKGSHNCITIKGVSYPKVKGWYNYVVTKGGHNYVTFKGGDYVTVKGSNYVALKAHHFRGNYVTVRALLAISDICRP